MAWGGHHSPLRGSVVFTRVVTHWAILRDTVLRALRPSGLDFCRRCITICSSSRYCTARSCPAVITLDRTSIVSAHQAAAWIPSSTLSNLHYLNLIRQMTTSTNFLNKHMNFVLAESTSHTQRNINFWKKWNLRSEYKTTVIEGKTLHLWVKKDRLQITSDPHGFRVAINSFHGKFIYSTPHAFWNQKVK